MSALFDDLLAIEGVKGVKFFSVAGELLFEESGAGGMDKTAVRDWQALLVSLDGAREADLIFETGRLYIRKADEGMLVVTMGRIAPAAMIRLNCDVLLPELKSNKGSGPLFEGAKLKRKKRAWDGFFSCRNSRISRLFESRFDSPSGSGPLRPKNISAFMRGTMDALNEPKGNRTVMRTDIDSRINEAEVCRSMGLFVEALAIYEKVLPAVAPHQSDLQETIKNRITLMKQEVAKEEGTAVARHVAQGSVFHPERDLGLRGRFRDCGQRFGLPGDGVAQ